MQTVASVRAILAVDDDGSRGTRRCQCRRRQPTPSRPRRTTAEIGDPVTATQNDAILMVELAQWGSMAGIDDAARDVMSDGFDPEQADAQDASVSKVLMFGETIGTLVKNGLLDRQLVYDWLWVEGSWAKVAPAA